MHVNIFQFAELKHTKEAARHVHKEVCPWQKMADYLNKLSNQPSYSINLAALFCTKCGKVGEMPYSNKELIQVYP